MNDTTQAGHAMNKAYDITMGYNVPLGLIQRIADALTAAQERIKLLEANDDPEALAISYDKGYSDARDRFKARIAELEAQVRKLKAEKQEAIEMIRSLGLPIEDIEVETMTREQYEKEYGDDD
jgi:DNA-directed RNA polymerase alpha subunit